MHAAFGLGEAIGVLAFDQQRRGLDPGLLARVIVDELDLHAAAFGPARVHALEHARPVLALGAAGARIDLDIGVVRVRLAREQRLDLVMLGAHGELGERLDALGLHLRIALGFGHLDQLDGVVEFRLDRLRGGDRLVESATLAHHLLRGLGVVPQRLVLDPCVEFVEPAQRAVPIEEAAEQRQRVLDAVDMGLRFGAHGRSPENARMADGPRIWKRR
jgi:hypothetical protein